MTRLLLLSALALTFTACGPRECVVSDPSTCPSDQVCESVQGRDKPVCFAPVTLKGKVFDLSTTNAIANAEVLATDENGAPAGTSTVSGADGTYTLRIPTTRSDDKGTVIGRRVMLRSQAKNYVPFPSGARVSLPIDTAAAAQKEKDVGPWIVQSPLTDVGLSPVEASAQNRPSVSGTVEVSADQRAVLLVIESGSATGRTTIAGADGKFTFFNVPSGGTKISAYTRGVNYPPVEVQVADADVKDVAFKKSTVPTASLSGSVQLVAGANGAGTSVVLVVESTFIDALGRGEVPPGLRAPESGTPNVTGAWSISGIPDGKYVVLAAFENDGNVRDPDPGISGTQVLHVTVSNGTLSGATSPAFKVTGAVTLVSPGAENVESTTATPTFTWTQYSNADAYMLRVFDSLGNSLWEKAIADKATVSTVYGGPALTSGQYYQWRVTALRRLAPTSQTEELRGLFRVQ